MKTHSLQEVAPQMCAPIKLLFKLDHPPPRNRDDASDERGQEMLRVINGMVLQSWSLDSSSSAPSLGTEGGGGLSCCSSRKPPNSALAVPSEKGDIVMSHEPS